jgi:glycine cleavage system H protein
MHLVFLGVFFAVFLSLITLLVLAVLRTLQDLRLQRVEAIRWAEDFENLPEANQVCRHALTGEVAHRTCVRGFDCRGCKGHEAIRAAADGRFDASAEADEHALGFTLPADRLYHRGHTWVRPEPDGTVTIGLDDFASRMIGQPDRVIFPETGSRLVVNGTGWRMRRGTAEVRILSPVDGEVIAPGAGDDGGYLRVRPLDGSLDTRHLLCSQEARPWILREMERLQGLLSAGGTGTSLADGGEPVQDLSTAIPETRRDEVLGEMLLEP